VLDPQWRDHLYEMDVLKTGIGLRGYNQKDPLTEYKQDSYKLFTDLVTRIKLEAVKVRCSLYNLILQHKQEEEAAVENIREEFRSRCSRYNTLSTDAPVEKKNKPHTADKKT
jgi:preprotein translocase subunit SecA